MVTRRQFINSLPFFTYGGNILSRTDRERYKKEMKRLDGVFEELSEVSISEVNEEKIRKLYQKSTVNESVIYELIGNKNRFGVISPLSSNLIDKIYSKSKRAFRLTQHLEILTISANFLNDFVDRYGYKLDSKVTITPDKTSENSLFSLNTDEMLLTMRRKQFQSKFDELFKQDRKWLQFKQENPYSIQKYVSESEEKAITNFQNMFDCLQIHHCALNYPFFNLDDIYYEGKLVQYCVGLAQDSQKSQAKETIERLNSSKPKIQNRKTDLTKIGDALHSTPLVYKSMKEQEEVTTELVTALNNSGTVPYNIAELYHSAIKEQKGTITRNGIQD